MLLNYHEESYREADFPAWLAQGLLLATSSQIIDRSALLVTSGTDDMPSLSSSLSSALEDQVARRLWAMLITKSGIPIELDEIERTLRLAQTPSEGKPPQIRIGNVEFTALEPANLQSVPLLIQALDNQWIPKQIWREMINTGRFTTEMEKRIGELARTEYIRGLINGKQVVINRAFMYNTPIVFQDYRPESQNREVFKALLGSGAIVPFLFNERSPVEPPSFGTTAQGFLAWQQICQEVNMSCVRLSWDDQLNEKLAREKLASRFHRYAENLVKGDLDKYLLDLNLGSREKGRLKTTFQRIQRMCRDLQKGGKLVSRTDLYKQFITDGSDPVQRRYDRNKPFAGEIKQLLDLAYNSYLADALGGYLLTPLDSLSRTALQEWEQAKEPQQAVTADELIRLLKLSGFEFAQRGRYLKSLGLLQLQEVQEVRQMDEWARYIIGVEMLLRNPTWFADGTAARIYQNYTDLLKKITNLLVHRGSLPESELTAVWTPLTELIIEVAGAQLSVQWFSDSRIYQFVGNAFPQVGPTESAPFVVRLNIHAWDGTSPHSELINSFNFMKGRLQDPQQQWKEIRRQVRALPGFQEKLAD